MKLIIASNNKHKIEEISAILSGKFEKIESLSEAGIVCDPEENGKTFLENAEIKADAVLKILKKQTKKNVNFDASKLCKSVYKCKPEVANVRHMRLRNYNDDIDIKDEKLPSDFAVLADDTGLCVDALGGEPGIMSARFAADETEEHDDAANRAKLLRKLKGTNNRKAHFECVVVLRYPNGGEIAATGRVDGWIAEEERGQNGFGYDSLFVAEEIGKTFAEATPEEKNRISHRGRALENLLKEI